MKMNQKFPINKIVVEDRARKDMGDLDALVESIKEKGIVQPIVLNSKNILQAGERRFRAAQQLEMTHVPVVIREYDGPIDDLEIELIENTLRRDFHWSERAALEKRIFEAKEKLDPSWTQRDQAAVTEASLGAVNRRIQLAEAMELIPELADMDSESDAWKEYKALEEEYATQELIKKTPDEVKQAARWASDHYQVADALRIMPTVNAEVAHFAEVDPPYAVDLVGDRKQRNKSKGKTTEYTEIDQDEYEAFYEQVASEVYRILKKDSFAVFWYGMTWHHEVLMILRKVGFKVPDIPAVWTKGAVGQTASPDTTFGSCYEPFFLARKGQPKLVKAGRSNVFDYKPVSPGKKTHTTEKPISLLKEIIETCVLPGSAVFCPFLGSGVTLRAAYALGNTGWGYDLSDKHKEAFLQKVYEEVKDNDGDPV